MNLLICCFSKQKEKGNVILHLGPWNKLGAHGHALGRSQEQGRRRRGFPGEEKARRRRGSGGTARGKRELLGGRLVEVGGGRERGRRRSSGSPVVANGGGGAPAALGARGACRGGSADHEEASLGVNLSRGRAESRAPRRPTEERRPWRRRGCSGRRQGLGWPSVAREGRVEVR